MARQLRSKRQPVVVEDETAQDVQTAQTVLQVETVVLEDITANANIDCVSESLEQMHISENDLPKKGKGKGRQAKKGRKGSKKTKKMAQPIAELPDAGEGDTALERAVKKTCEDMMQIAEVEIPNTPKPTGTERKTENKITQTPRFNPEVHDPHVDTCHKSTEDESLLEIIVSRSPSKPTVLPKSPSICDDKSALFETPRTNESIAHESAQPTLADTEPVRADSITNAMPSGQKKGSKVASLAQSPKPKTAQTKSDIVRNGFTKETAGTGKSCLLAKSKPGAPKLASKDKIMSTAPKLSRSSVTTSTALNQKRPVVSTAPAPVKSTKPLTKPSFELPGEAVARKLKAQREERLKQDEQSKNISSNNTHPSKLKAATVVVRGTAASKARESIMTRFQTEAPVRKTSLNRSFSLTAKMQKPTTTSATRPTTLSRSFIAKKPSPVPSAPVSLKTTKAKPVTVSQKPILVISETKVRPLISKDMKEHQAREKERLEREAAAKRAREEAADRGRQASRAWAEAQRIKKASGTAAGSMAPTVTV